MLRSAAALALTSLLMTSACSETEAPTQADRAAAESVPGAPPGGVEDLSAKHAAALNLREKNDLIEFAYAYPVEAARIPALVKWLDNDRATKREALLVDARRDRAAAEKEGFPYQAHSDLQAWERVTNTPRFLSLSSDISTYTGGAHGMTSFDTLIWNRNRAIRLKPLDLFTSGEAFDAAIRKPFCEAIVRAKAARGIAPSDDPEGIFEKCPAASTQTVWLGSSDGKYLDRLTIGIAPYEIGPYAEGNYKINVPVTGALGKMVKPEYQRDFLPLN